MSVDGKFRILGKAAIIGLGVGSGAVAAFVYLSIAVVVYVVPTCFLLGCDNTEAFAPYAIGAALASGLANADP
jgi:hypothetical protein